MMNKAKACRLGQPCAPRTFKQLLACRTQHHPQLDAERIAELAELRKDRLYAFSNENDPSEISHKALLKVCAAIQNWDLLDFDLEPYGLRTVAMVRSAARNVVTELLDAHVEQGRLTERVRSAASDGHIDDEEGTDIKRLTRSVRRELDDIDSAVDNAKARTA